MLAELNRIGPFLACFGQDTFKVRIEDTNVLFLGKKEVAEALQAVFSSPQQLSDPLYPETPPPFPSPLLTLKPGCARSMSTGILM